MKNKKTAEAFPCSPIVEKRITLFREASVEMEEKKSVFIAHARPVATEDEARAFVETKRHEYADATHNVYAYSLNRGAVGRYSDDGEPQGTAGLPVFNTVKMSGADDLVVVVTRYFGGILLGAGGLVRAYAASAKLALDAAGRAVFEPYTLYSIKVSYPDYQKLAPTLSTLGVSVDSVQFEDAVRMAVAFPKTESERVPLAVSEVTAGRGECRLLGEEERVSGQTDEKKDK